MVLWLERGTVVSILKRYVDGALADPSSTPIGGEPLLGSVVVRLVAEPWLVLHRMLTFGVPVSGSVRALPPMT